MTAFGTIFAYKASRTTAESEDPVLDFDRIASNQRRGIETNFVADTNLMIQIDEALDVARPATDVTLRELGLLEWVTFLRECDKRGLHYAFSPFFAYAEMPAKYAQLRAARLQTFAAKFGLLWADDEISVKDVSALGREDMTFEGLSEHHQMLVAISFSTLLLMLTVQRDGVDFSSVGKYRRFLREHKAHIGTVSVRELAIARYVFASPEDCPGPLNELRAKVKNNFAAVPRKGRAPRDHAEMCATALNGALDLMLFHALNVADTNGLDGRKLDCWLHSSDGKLKVFNELCYNLDLGTGQAGLFAAVSSHEDVSEYWCQTRENLHEIVRAGSKRAFHNIVRNVLGVDDDAAKLAKLRKLPELAKRMIELSALNLDEFDRGARVAE
ncbi:hypothetical protein [Burkholderia lata]|uniref:hypothetical protein n=1 Tax=Burkholderia lata (strain ATCC 17760 / DSM 23089 / LMG 22485 / NCIMB 9086 / R18194 / 383) TaxID=482957 RepID=UPI001453A3CE|nr:hypothetical protein [Burkholderia lata]VWB43061.1 hypothetical protein BLA15816_01954 [Burkholderia lata]